MATAGGFRTAPCMLDLPTHAATHKPPNVALMGIEHIAQLQRKPLVPVFPHRDRTGGIQGFQQMGLARAVGADEDIDTGRERLVESGKGREIVQPEVSDLAS